MPRKFILASRLERIEERFQVHLSSYTKVWPASYNISGRDITYVITIENLTDLQAMQFGLTPYFAKKPMDLINARAEGDKNPSNDPGYSGPLHILTTNKKLKLSKLYSLYLLHENRSNY